MIIGIMLVKKIPQFVLFQCVAACVTVVACNATAAAAGRAPSQPDLAARFGALESIWNPALSPDGKRVVYVSPGKGGATRVVVGDIASNVWQVVLTADAGVLRLAGCDWSAADRIVCMSRGEATVGGQLLPVSRFMAMDADGRNLKPLGQRNSSQQLWIRQFDGGVIDWLEGRSGNVLMARSYVPEASTGSLVARHEEGNGVDLVDTRTGSTKTVERPRVNADLFVSDGHGEVRILGVEQADSHGQLKGYADLMYRKSGAHDWLPFGQTDVEHDGMQPLAVDPSLDAAYVLKRQNGHNALFRVSLDGTAKSEAVLARDDVDIDGVVGVGRNGHIIGAHFVTDRSQVQYFDAAYRTLAAGIAKAMPPGTMVSFASASADEQVLLVYTSSDTNPGRYWLLDRASNKLAALMSPRSELAGLALSQVKAMSYPAADGAAIPAYLTLPPGHDDAKGIPAIVLPHGGPAARDEWGFDWLAQYFAQRGFAVLQPNYRGSAGYGDKWFVDNGFKSWRTALGDVLDGGRWLVSQGIADPARLAIVGWSYGGYAALQANVVDPDLFKAVVAVAPVTDLERLKAESSGYTNANIMHDYIGSGPHIEEGSPARHADRFKAPVLMFHADHDINVAINESRIMDAALKRAGKSTRFVQYTGLEHSLRDGDVRANMLRQADEFLRTSLGIH